MEQIPTLEELAHQIALAWLEGRQQECLTLQGYADTLGYQYLTSAVVRAIRKIKQEEELLADLLQDVDLSGLDELAA